MFSECQTFAASIPVSGPRDRRQSAEDAAQVVVVVEEEEARVCLSTPHHFWQRSFHNWQRTVRLSVARVVARRRSSGRSWTASFRSFSRTYVTVRNLKNVIISNLNLRNQM